MKSKTLSTIPGARLLASTLVACAASLATPLAADAIGTDAYVALGDSYTSAPFTGLPTSVFCAQSNDNYPRLVAAAIQPASFTDVSCAGAVTDDMTGPQPNDSGLGTNPPQFNALSPSTSLVTIGIGGNDAGLVGAAYQCFELDLLRPTGSACRDHYTTGSVNQIGDMIDQIAPKLAAVYQGIHARSPQARVLAVGYPAVLPVDGSGCWPLTPLSPDDVSFMASILVGINQTIATVAAANNVQYVDTYEPTIGYDVCQAIGHAGFTALLPTSGISAPLHPNALGERLMAGAVINAIENPPAAVSPTPVRPGNPHLKFTRVTISHSAVTARGTINRSYDGRVNVAFRSYYRAYLVTLHGSTFVAHGRWRVTLRIPHQYASKLRSGRLIATSHLQNRLAASTAYARLILDGITTRSTA